jgi:hypothetical protein
MKRKSGGEGRIESHTGQATECAVGLLDERHQPANLHGWLRREGWRHVGALVFIAKAGADETAVALIAEFGLVKGLRENGVPQ